MLGLLSEACQAYTNARMALKRLWQPLTSIHWGIDRLLLLYIDLASYFLWCFKHKRTSFENIWQSNFLTCFSPPLPRLSTTPSNYPYVSSCGIDEKLSKIVDSSIRYLLNSSLYNGGEMLASSTMILEI